MTDLERETSDGVQHVLQSFNISPIHGFLRDSPPLRYLPSPFSQKYAVWEQMLLDLPQLIIAQSLQRKLTLNLSMPVISDISDIINCSDLRVQQRANNILSFFANAFVFENQILLTEPPPTPRDFLPANIAIPLYKLCKHMQLPPIIRHENLVLNNYRLLFGDDNNNRGHGHGHGHGRVCDDIHNLALNNLFQFGTDENMFFLVAAIIESRGGILLTSMLSIQAIARRITSTTTTTSMTAKPHPMLLMNAGMELIEMHLQRMLDAIHSLIVDCLAQYFERLDPHIFYNRVRVFLNGFTVEFKGVPKTEPALIGTTKIDDDPNREYLCLQVHGASAAQSSLFPCIDYFFGIDQSNDEFLSLMIQYMPLKHRQFIFWLRNETKNMHGCLQALKVFALAMNLDVNSSLRSVERLYEKCVAKLKEFRTFHLKVATEFIIAPSAKLQKKRNSGTSEEKGTGGSSLVSFLKGIRDRTTTAPRPPVSVNKDAALLPSKL